MTVELLFELIEKNEKELSLPIIVQNSSEVIPMMYSKFEWYIEFIKENLQDEYARAELIVSRLKQAIEFTVAGKPDRANKSIQLILNNDEKLGKVIDIKKINELFYEEDMRRLYKARCGGVYGYAASQMFHIPFDKLNLIGNQRYSINGIPCLYLGSSPYVCWEELGRPDFNSFWVSRYEVTDLNLQILNLSTTIQEVKLSKKHNKFDIQSGISYLLTWILQCISSITVKNKEGSFRPEYIIPQLIMTNIRSKNIDGVLYTSVKGNYLKHHSSYIMKNIAIPADDNKFNKTEDDKFDVEKYRKNKYSKRLTSIFKVSNPVNMGFTLSMNGNNLELYRSSFLNEANKHNVSPIEERPYHRVNQIINVSQDNNYQYGDTNFMTMETILDRTFPEYLSTTQ